MRTKIMSLDVESNGLWGNPISIGFTIEENGKVIKKAEACYIDEKENYDEWITTNVINPLKENKKVLHLSSYLELLKWFADEYNSYKDEYTVVYHQGHIVESNLFKELVNHKLIGIWDAPYTPIEMSVILEMNGFNPDSVDSLVKQGLIEKPLESQTHQALYDAEVTGRAYWYFYNLLNK